MTTPTHRSIHRARAARAAVGAALTICATLAVAGCGNDAAPGERAGAAAQTSPASSERGASTAVLERLQAGFNVATTYDTAGARAAEVPVALTGTIEDVVDGPAVASDTGSDEFEVREEFAFVRVRVDHVYKAEGVKVGDAVYVVLSRGSHSTDLNGDPLDAGPSTVVSVDELRTSLAHGARVVVLSELRPGAGDDSAAGDRVVDEGAAHDPSLPVLRGDAPQSFAVEDGATGVLSGWEKLTYAQAVADLGKTLP